MAKASASLEKLLLALETSKVSDVDIVSEIEQSFLDYSMSVIASRALPNIKDGLKPVHRRIIFAAHQEGLYNNKKFKKSAALVGTVMGSYHPHGDLSIYEALARLSQDFNMRYPLIEGQGNFGSIDGDSPAAMRYTEVKLSKLGEYFLDGIKENCVDFVPNYDGSKEEPVVLPTIIPNILLNGCTGIAVGLASNIPPHNIGELCDAAIATIDNPDITIDEICQLIKGPDFPTAGEVLNYSGIKKYLTTGRGSFMIRSKVVIEEEEKRNLIIVKEIPYGIKKTNLIKKIISLVKPATKYEKPIPILENNITNIRDESNLEGIRLIIECRKDINAQIIVNYLYKFTQLQSQYSANITVLVDMQPKVLNILEILKLYVEHQIDMLIRKTTFNLEKIKHQIHIMEGRQVVASNLLKVIDIISNSENPEEEMASTFQLSQIQIKDIFQLPLRSIKKIEQLKLIEELKSMNQSKKEHEDILALPEKQNEIIKNKLVDLKKHFGDARRTKINYKEQGYISKEDLIPTQKVVITLSEKGYISQIPLKAFKLHKRGGVGTKGGSIYQDDQIKMLLTCYPLDDIFIFTDVGKVYKLKAYELHMSKEKTDKSQNVLSILPSMTKSEKILTIMAVKKEDYSDGIYLLFATKDGVVKKTHIKHFRSIRANGKKAFILKTDDRLKFVIKTNNDSEILLASSLGKVVKFKAKELRSLSRNAVGVRGIRLPEKSILVSASSSFEGNKVISIGEKGRGKITDINEFRLTKRGSIGVLCQKITAKTGHLLACTAVNADHEILLMTNTNKINRFKISDVSVSSRVTSGVILFKVEETKEKIIYFAKNIVDFDENNDFLDKTKED